MLRGIHQLASRCSAFRCSSSRCCTQSDRKDCPVVEVDYRVVPKRKASACVAEKVPK
jgi:hypothetical protein